MACRMLGQPFHWRCFLVGLPSKGVSVNPKEKIISGDAVSDESKNANRNLLIVSGGEGYVDFRLGERTKYSHRHFVCF